MNNIHTTFIVCSLDRLGLFFSGILLCWSRSRCL